MRHCNNCEFHGRTMMQMGPGQAGMVDICNHHECSNPVDATPLPCGAVRNNEAFCGIKGRYFKIKAEAPKPPSKDNIIQMA